MYVICFLFLFMICLFYIICFCIYVKTFLFSLRELQKFFKLLIVKKYQHFNSFHFYVKSKFYYMVVRRHSAGKIW